MRQSVRHTTRVTDGAKRTFVQNKLKQMGKSADWNESARDHLLKEQDSEHDVSREQMRVASDWIEITVELERLRESAIKIEDFLFCNRQMRSIFHTFLN